MGLSFREEGMKEFKLTEQHIALLSKAITSWDDTEFGAPCIDPKRPYGNSSVYEDMVKILRLPHNACPHCGELLDKFDEDALCAIHKETEIALQIVLATKSFQPGSYVAGDYSRDWKIKEPAK